MFVRLAPRSKLARVEHASREEPSVSDSAVSLLAARVGFTFTPSGRPLRAALQAVSTAEEGLVGRSITGAATWPADRPRQRTRAAGITS